MPTALLLAMFLLAKPASTHAWVWATWHQVGLDLQPWRPQPNSLKACKSTLGCPYYRTGLGENRMYSMAGVTVGTTMTLIMSRLMLQRWHSQVTTSRSEPWEWRAPVSNRTLLLRVLHMLDALLVHIECHLHHLATQRQIQIKKTVN
ncbi:transmembrane protein 89 [Ctenodactylus gundi]